MRLRKILIFILVIAALMAPAVPANAAIAGRPDTLEYVGRIEISAYWPYEDHYNNNFRCEPLEGLVGEIVAAPTGSDLLGKDLLILCPDGTLLERRVWDTGCRPGRLDMLVAGPREMDAWGLRDCHVWVINEEAKRKGLPLPRPGK